MSDMTQVLGIVAMEPKGEYSAFSYYEKLNVVTYEGSSYVAKQSCTGITPTNTEYWELVAEKGDDGPQGPKPIKGTDYYTTSDIEDLELTLSNDVSEEVSNQLGDLVSATPLAASSVSGMSDTTRVYVNTTDGHWYWYNGSAWTDGGVYQSTQSQEEIDARENFNGVSYNSLEDSLKTQFSELYENNIFKINYKDLVMTNKYIKDTGDYGTSQDYYLTFSISFFAKKGSSIKIGSNYNFKIFRYNDYHTATTSNFVGTSGEKKEYVFTEDSIFRIMCYKGTTASDNLWSNGELNSLGEDLLDSLEFNFYLVNNEIKDYKKTITPKFYIGNLTNDVGTVNWANTKRLISNYIKVREGIVINNSNLYSFTIGFYDKDKNYLGYKSFDDNRYIYKINTANCEYIRVGIKNFSNADFAFSTLTQNEINEIGSCITIYTNEDDFSDTIADNLSNNFLGEEIINEKYLPNNLEIEKTILIDAFDIINTTPFTHDTSEATQGFTSDKKRYLYATIDNGDTNPCGLVKYDLLKDRVEKSIYATVYGHGNGMTYVEKTNELWIASFDYDNQTDLSRISKVDAETLEFKEHIDLQSMLNGYFANIMPNPNGIGAITYNKTRDKFVYLIRKTKDINNEYKRALLICDANNNPIKHVLMADVFRGGIESDENYIYVNLPSNKIEVYDWELNFVGNINYSVSGAESEGLVIMKNAIYTNANYQDNQYIYLYKLNTSKFNFRN